MATLPITHRTTAAQNQPQPEPELGDLLVAYLEQIGVEHLFGVPGGAIEPLYNAMARSQRRGGLSPVVARHETGAAFMADGYARQTGKLGVCCATTGPGTTNLITGVASAYESHVPMLVVTAQTALANFGRGALQESSCTGVNTVGMFQYCTRYNSLVSHPDQFEHKLVAAIMSAYQSPRGPAHLSVPRDVLRTRAGVAGPRFDLRSLLHRPALLDDAAVTRLCGELERANKVVFVIGEEASEAVGVILELAGEIDGRIVATPQGKGLINHYHPLFRGVVGFAGHRTARELLSDPSVDTVVAVGTGLGEWASDGWNTNVLLNERLIHVASEEISLTRSPMARLHVRGRVGTVFERVLEHIRQVGARRTIRPVSVDDRRGAGSAHRRRYFCLDDEAAYRDDAAPIKPQRLMRELPRVFPPNTRFLADNGNSTAWALHYLNPVDRRSSGLRAANGGVLRTSLEFASMGWAIGAAVGTAVGCPTAPVVCITGDGSLLMSGQEITVAVQERLCVIFVVLNDNALGMVKHGQRLGGAEPVAFDLPEVDFAELARSLGADGYVVRSPDELHRLDMNAICGRRRPTVLDVRVDPNAVPPMGTRVRVLGGKS